jgi:acylaminoacyl-peptidase
MVLYSAEANAPSREVDISARKGEGSLGDWEYRAPLGEKFGGQAEPSVFLLHFSITDSGAARVLRLAAPVNSSDPALRSALLGQAVFSSSGKAIYLTAYPTLPDGRRLGIIYCSNRPAVVYKIATEEMRGEDVKDEEDGSSTAKVWRPRSWTRLSASGSSARSPRSKAELIRAFG